MSSSLADLFSDNSPARQAPRPRSRSRSASPASHAGATRRRADANNPLFLSPGAASVYSPARPRNNNNYDYDDDDDGAHPRSPRSRSRSPARAAQRAPLDPLNFNNAGTTGRVVPRGMFDDPFSVQDPTALGGGTAVMVLGDDNAEGDEAEPRVRKKRAVVNAERLMGPKGFPALMPVARRWKSKGKGNEAKDLARLLDMYQMWAHGMYPRGEFVDTLKRVETVSRTARMQSALSGLRDAYEQENRPQDPVDDFPSTPQQHRRIENTPATGGEMGGGGMFNEDMDGMEEDDIALEMERADTGPTGSNARSRPAPLFDMPDDMPDEDELEELAAMEEMEREEAERAKQKNGSVAAAFATVPPLFEDEDDPYPGLYD